MPTLRDIYFHQTLCYERGKQENIGLYIKPGRQEGGMERGERREIS